MLSNNITKLIEPKPIKKELFPISLQGPLLRNFEIPKHAVAVDVAKVVKNSVSLRNDPTGLVQSQLPRAQMKRSMCTCGALSRKGSKGH